LKYLKPAACLALLLPIVLILVLSSSPYGIPMGRLPYRPACTHLTRSELVFDKDFHLCECDGTQWRRVRFWKPEVCEF
jgi:hypothetical protein